MKQGVNQTNTFVFPHGTLQVGQTEPAGADILVDNKDSSYIYSGWLYEFILSKEEGLDFLCLNGVRRRKLDMDKRDEPEIERGVVQEFRLQRCDFPG